MGGTEIVPVRVPWHYDNWYVMLPDGSVRRPIDAQDLDFWTLFGRAFLGYYQLGDTWIGNVRVSTMFLHIDQDHGLSWDWSDPYRPKLPIGYRPLCFETMIFGGDLNGYQARTRDYLDAMANHEEAVRKVKGEGIYKCPKCGRVSHNPGDAIHRFCGACGWEVPAGAWTPS
jgi:hypothetical protein